MSMNSVTDSIHARDMKSFLLRFRGTIYLGASTAKIAPKWVKTNHVVYVVNGPFDRVWAEEPPLIFSWIKEYMFIYLQTYHEKHWILRVFYRIFWISIFNTYSYGELFTGVSPIVGIYSTYSRYNQIMDCARSRHHAPLAVDWPLSATPPPSPTK